MKGLCFRELYLAKKNYLTIAFTFALFLILEIMVCLSLHFGNLSKLDSEIFSKIQKIAYYEFIIVSAVFCCSPFLKDGGVTISDKNSHWDAFFCTFPIRAEKLVMTKYLIKLVGFGLALVISLLNALLVSNACGRSFDMMTFKIIAAIVAAFAFCSFIYLPLILRFKSAAKAELAGTVLLVIPYLAVIAKLYVFLQDMRDKGYDDDKIGIMLSKSVFKIWHNILPYLIPGAVVLFILTAAASFFISVKIVKGRKNL